MSEPVKIDDLTIFNAATNKSIFVEALESGVSQFDLSEVGEIDTSGIQLLIGVVKQSNAAGNTVEFIGAGSEIIELVSQFKLSELLGIAA